MLINYKSINHLWRVLLLSLAVITSAHARVHGIENANMALGIRQWVNYDLKQTDAGYNNDGDKLARTLSSFYTLRRFRPVWIDTGGYSIRGKKVLNILKAGSDDQWPELTAQLEFIDQIVEDSQILSKAGFAFPEETLLQLEVRMSRMVLRYLSLIPEFLDDRPLGAFRQIAQLGFGEPDAILALNLADALTFDEIASIRNALDRRPGQYHALEEALALYEAIQVQGGWPRIEAGPKLAVGVRSIRVSALRRRLAATNDIPLAHVDAENQFDGSLDRAVRRFQRRHGLKVDGIVGSRTLSVLNVPVEERIRQIRLNLHRWGKMPAELGNRYLMVNIPRFQLDIVEDGQVVKSMRAIVGKEQRRTPVLSGKMTYMEINPYWNIPQTIAKKDLLPKIKTDPGFLVRQKIEVFDSWRSDAAHLDPLQIDWRRYSKNHFPFRLRQAPASVNALGKIKFMFPNKFSVYIHDTPNKSLFRQNRRSFSSGCVRVENPADLAAYLLKDQQKDRQRFESGLKTRKRQVIVLNRPIPVHFVYFTTWSENGVPHFADDLYALDPKAPYETASHSPALPAVKADRKHS